MTLPVPQRHTPLATGLIPHSEMQSPLSPANGNRGVVAEAWHCMAQQHPYRTIKNAPVASGQRALLNLWPLAVPALLPKAVVVRLLQAPPSGALHALSP